MKGPEKEAFLREVGEFSLHSWLASILPRHPSDPIGLGDDCAVLDLLPDRYLLLTTDRAPLSAYKRSYAYLGRLCVTHNFSDIICKGGTPIGLLLGTYVPRETRFEDWQTLIVAAKEWAEKFGGYILGGDTKEAPYTSIVGCAVGLVEKRQLLSRKGASVGDAVALSLTSAEPMGIPWIYILATSLSWDMPHEELDFLEHCFMTQNLSLPYKETLAANREPGISASADSSDGLGGALHLLSSSNRLGIDLQYDALISCLHAKVLGYAERLALDPVRFIFTPGYVWENLFTITPSAFDDVRARVRGVGGDLVRIGTITESYPGIRLMMPDGCAFVLDLFFNEGFRSDREISNSTTAWLRHNPLMARV